MTEKLVKIGQKFSIRIALALMLLSVICIGTAYAGNELFEVANEGSKLAADKDIIRLSIYLSMSCLGFSAWIIKMWMGQNDRVVRAIEKMASEPCPKDGLKKKEKE